MTAYICYFLLCSSELKLIKRDNGEGGYLVNGLNNNASSSSLTHGSGAKNQFNTRCFVRSSLFYSKQK